MTTAHTMVARATSPTGDGQNAVPAGITGTAICTGDTFVAYYWLAFGDISCGFVQGKGKAREKTKI